MLLSSLCLDDLLIAAIDLFLFSRLSAFLVASQSARPLCGPVPSALLLRLASPFSTQREAQRNKHARKRNACSDGLGSSPKGLERGSTFGTSFGREQGHTGIVRRWSQLQLFSPDRPGGRK